MKKITFLMALIAACTMQAQVTTGVINFATGYTGEITIDTSDVTVTLIGPDDLWLGLGFGVDSMTTGGDVITHDASGFNDRQFLGVGTEPSPDTQDWTVVSNNVMSGVRQLTVTRPLAGSDASDFTFDENASSILLVWAHGDGTDNFSYHGANNRNAIVAALNPILSVDDNSLANNLKIFPVPATDLVTVSLTDFDNEKATIQLYSMLGQQVQELTVSEKSTIIDISTLPSGVYLVNVSTTNGFASKKIIKN